MHWYSENKNVFNKCLKLSVVRSGSRRLSGREFQTVRPATAKARRPYLLRRWPGRPTARSHAGLLSSGWWSCYRHTFDNGNGNVDLYSACIWSIAKALRYSTHCQWISQFYLHTLHFILKRNEPYLPLLSQPQLILIYQPRTDRRLDEDLRAK